MFSDCSSLTSVNMSGWNTSNVTNMSYMFNGCSSMPSLDFVKSFDTSKVTSFQSMFCGCSSVKSFDLAGWNTANVTDMSDMFQSTGVTSLDFSNWGWNTSNVTNMSYMFDDCPSLTSLDVSSFNTSKVTTMQSMFMNCPSLKSLNVSGFDTSNVTTMQGIFIGCSSLVSLDLSSWDMSNTTNTNTMFTNDRSLHVVKTPSNNASDIIFNVNVNDGTFNVLDGVTVKTDTEYDTIPAGSSSMLLVRHDNHEWSDYVLQPDGRYVSTCGICGAERECTHNYEETGHTDATCTEKGSTTYTCTECGHSYSDYTDALGHIEGEPVIENRVEATCEAKGSYDKVIYCDRCHAELSRETIEIEAHGHEAGDKVIENEVAATCTAAGSYDEVIYCKTCNKELSRETKTIPAIGHDWGEWEVTTKPSCTSEGVETRVCKNDSSHVETKAIPAIGHDWGEWEVTTKPTCTEEGVATRVCKNDSRLFQ